MENTEILDIGNYETRLGEFEEIVSNYIKEADSIAVILVSKDKHLYQGFISEGGNDSYKLITGLQIVLNKLITDVQ